MSEPTASEDQNLRVRVDELETRLECLEAVLLEEASESGPTLGARLEQAPAAAIEARRTTLPVAAFAVPEQRSFTVGVEARDEGFVDPEQRLRQLKAKATADLPVEPLISSYEPPALSFDIRDIEERLAGRILALVGGTALLLGAVFFLSLAFSRGWIGPSMQVALGLAGGSLGLLVGAFLLFRDERIVGQVLTAVGLAVISLSLFAATSLYELIEPTLALAGVFVAAAVTTVVAVHSRSQVVAGFGLVAALAAPPILGADPDLITVAYMAAALLGIATVSMWQSWWWLPPIAFVLSLPQLYEWVATEPELVLGVPALLAYWAVMTVAAGGEAFRSRRRELSVTSAPLFLAVGASVIGLSSIILEPDTQRAAFLLALASCHGLMTAFFIRRRGLLHPFGLLAGAYGIAMATAAVPLLLDASTTAVVWSAEAAALALLAGRRSHGPALIGSLVIYAVAAVDLSYEVLLLGPAGEAMHEAMATGTTAGAVVGFAFFVAAGVVSMVFVPSRSYRLLIVGTIAIVALPFTYLMLDGVSAVAAWMAVAVIALGTTRWLALLTERHIRWRLGPALEWLRPTVDTIELASLWPQFAGLAAMLLAAMGTVAAIIAQDQLPTVPFNDRAGLSALALASGFVAVGFVAGGGANRRRGLCAAGLAIGLVALVEFPVPWFAPVWVALALAAALSSRSDRGGIVSYRRMSLASLAVLAVIALTQAPPMRLVVADGGVPPHPLFVSDATLALGSLMAALIAVAALGAAHWSPRSDHRSRGARGRRGHLSAFGRRGGCLRR